MAYKSPNKPPTPTRFVVECINSSVRPSQVPLSKWVKKGERYTVVGVSAMLSQGVYGLFLEGHDISDCYPYKNFHSSRFVPVDNVSFTEAIEESAPQMSEKELELEEA